MKTGFLLLLLHASLCCPLAGQGITQTEVERVAKNIVMQLQKKRAVKKVGIDQFTVNKQPSQLGSYISEELSTALFLMDRKTFDLILDQEAVPEKPRNNNKSIINSVIKNASEVYSDKKPERAREARSIGEVGTVINESMPQRDRKHRGVDAIIVGDLTEFSSNFRLSVKVLDLSGQLLAAAMQDITKTPSVIEMAKAGTPVGGGGGGSQQSFQKDILLFDLSGCRQSGSNLECTFQVKNEGRQDVDLYVYSNHSRAINKSGSLEYHVSSLKFADVYNSQNVSKTLTPNNSATLTLTFANAREAVSTLSKLEIQCYSTYSHYFKAEFVDIPLGRP